ncbi:DUF6683 family protein [Larkinella terrae]|uniref:DUF4919 domain-containing protein n=1 Tax=Larkinella terrae TaxID=2025311 RepID=A0A7K0ENX5_9BACT|nr:DUF6683 family protein [Larkinella terrae]MRS63251.1 hypothetical protein [Larkinella terrae]
MKNRCKLALAVFLFLSTTVFAQYEMASSVANGEALFQSNFSAINSTLLNSYSKKKSTSEKPLALTPSKLKALDFSRSSSISEKIKKLFINQITQANPSAEPQLEQLFANNRLVTEFDNLLAGYGFSGRNLADALTAYLVINWQIANNQEFNDPNGFNNVRRVMQVALLSSEELADLQDRDKQTIAETMAYQSLIMRTAYQDLKKANNRAGLANLQKIVHKSVKDLGFDLKAVRLTSAGFVKKVR